VFVADIGVVDVVAAVVSIIAVALKVGVCSEQEGDAVAKESVVVDNVAMAVFAARAHVRGVGIASVVVGLNNHLDLVRIVVEIFVPIDLKKEAIVLLRVVVDGKKEPDVDIVVDEEKEMMIGGVAHHETHVFVHVGLDDIALEDLLVLLVDVDKEIAVVVEKEVVAEDL